MAKHHNRLNGNGDVPQRRRRNGSQNGNGHSEDNSYASEEPLNGSGHTPRDKQVKLSYPPDYFSPENMRARSRSPGKGTKGGTKPIYNIDPDEVEKLAFLGVKIPEIAGLYDCDPETIRRRYERPFYRGRARRAIALRDAETAKAMAGDTAMLIFLGKNELGQSDKVEYNHRGLLTREHADAIARIMRDPALNAAYELHARKQLAMNPPEDDPEIVDGEIADPDDDDEQTPPSKN